MKRAGVVLVGPPLFDAVPDSFEGRGFEIAVADRVEADFDAIGRIAAARDTLTTKRRLVVGFGSGGLHARLAACVLPGFAGAVSFGGAIVHPTLSPEHPAQPLDLLPGLGCALLCHFDDAPAEHLQELNRRLAQTRPPTLIFTYPDLRAASSLAWARTLNFIEHVLAPAG